MNAIKNFARDYGKEEYGNAYGQNLESEFRSCVQSVIGDKGDVIDAWNDGGSEGYAEWHCSIKNVEGMAPDTEFMLTLVTDLEDGNSWLTCQYDTADCDVLGESDGHVGDFDPFPLIDKCLKQAGKSESKKNERGSTNIETYDGFEELLGYADAEYLLEDVVDVLSKYYTYEDETFDEDQAKDDPEFTIKIEGGDERADFYSEDIFYVHLPNKEAAEELAKVLGGELNESKKDGGSIRDTKCVRCGGSPAMYKLDGCSGNFCLSCAKELHWECPKELKDKKTAGKKESMERCDSCGAVMTEYDYDRYGGLCKHCRDKGEAKKSEAGGSVDAQTFPNITDTTLQVLKQGGHRVSATTLEDVVADLAYGEAAGSGIFDSSKKISVKDVLKQTINDFDNSPLNIGKGLIEQFAVNNKDRLREIYPIALKECDVELSPDFEDTYNSDDLYPFMKWVIVKVADALYNKVSESKKSESIGSRIKMGIDYNMFMRMCRTAAYLDEDEDYWDALWEYYSEMGEIEDALVFFDNLFQYTAWCDADEVYDEYLDDKFKDKSKSKEECIDAAIDDGDLQAYKHEKGNYLVIL